MPPGEVAILIVLVILGIAGTGYGVHRLDRKRMVSKKRKGRDNAMDARNAAELRCVECGSKTDPDSGDVYDRSAWWCLKCWNKLHT
jgi:hypothetical protein